jgi:hypothetical protein
MLQGQLYLYANRVFSFFLGNVDSCVKWSLFGGYVGMVVVYEVIRLGTACRTINAVVPKIQSTQEFRVSEKELWSFSHEN